jgi:hypothetical protein
MLLHVLLVRSAKQVLNPTHLIAAHLVWYHMVRYPKMTVRQAMQFPQGSHGHYIVTYNDESNEALVKWVSAQRVVFREGSMDDSRKQLLEASIGVEELMDWNEKYTKLRTFHEVFQIHNGSR